MKYMTMEQFKSHQGQWGFLTVPIRNETLAVRDEKEIAAELLTQFRRQAEDMGAVLVRDSLHKYSDHDKELFGFTQPDGHTSFVIYVTKLL